MEKQALKDRTKKFALDIIKFTEGLPKTETGRVIGKQLLRAGTAVGANYRAACRASSTQEFIAKLGIVVEESDELTAIMYATRVSSINKNR